jgi:hypothetical protein
MAEVHFGYKGKQVAIVEKHPDAVVEIDGRGFSCHHHHEQSGVGLAMWMCEESYFASPDIRELARHFADYGYLFDAAGRVRVDGDGNVITTPPVGGGHGGGH